MADLELQANIIKDDCKCIIKYDEPVITLAKEQRGVLVWLTQTEGE